MSHCVASLLYLSSSSDNGLVGHPGRCSPSPIACPPPLGRGANHCDEYAYLSARLSVCLSARISRKRHGRTSPNSVHVDRGRGSVFLRRRFCDSGFVDNVTFSHNGPYGASCVFISRERIVCQLKLLHRFEPNLLNGKDQLLTVDCSPRTKFVMHGCLAL